MGTSGPGLGQEGDCRAQLMENQGDTVFLGICPWSGQGHRHTQPPLLDDVGAEGTMQTTEPGVSRRRVCRRASGTRPGGTWIHAQLRLPSVT